MLLTIQSPPPPTQLNDLLLLLGVWGEHNRSCQTISPNRILPVNLHIDISIHPVFISSWGWEQLREKFLVKQFQTCQEGA